MNISNIIREVIEKLLAEGLSKILYHFTYIPHLINILKTNKFATSSNLGSTADASKDKGKFFFFSTQRSKGTSGYGKHHGNVAIVLDGEKLNQSFKGFPTDYWTWSKKRSDYDNQSAYIQALTSSELEDRIVTDKPYIENADKYILEIHINAEQHIDKKEVADIVNLTHEHNIPVFFYNNDNDFKLQNKAKAIAPEKLEVPEDIERYTSEKNITWDFKSLAPYIISGHGGIFNESIVHNLLKKYLQSINNIDQFNNIIKDIDDKVKKINTSWSRLYYDDEVRSISADIHNNRGNPSPYYRELLKIMITDMKKIGAKNLKEYIIKKVSQSNIAPVQTT